MHTSEEQQAVQGAQPKRERANNLGRKIRYEGTRWPCPQCRAQSEIKSSYMPTDTMRRSSYQCTNVECGCTFVVYAEVGHLMNPGATPNPANNIPLSSHVRRGLLRVVLDNASEVAYQSKFTPPVTGDLFADGDTS